MTTARLHQIIKLLRAELALIDKTIAALEAAAAQYSGAVAEETSRSSKPHKK